MAVERASVIFVTIAFIISIVLSSGSLPSYPPCDVNCGGGQSTSEILCDQGANGECVSTTVECNTMSCNRELATHFIYIVASRSVYVIACVAE